MSLITYSYLVYDIFQLHHSNTNQSIFSSKTPVFDTDMQLKVIQLFFIANNTTKDKNIENVSINMNNKSIAYK